MRSAPTSCPIYPGCMHATLAALPGWLGLHRFPPHASLALVSSSAMLMRFLRDVEYNSLQPMAITHEDMMPQHTHIRLTPMGWQQPVKRTGGFDVWPLVSDESTFTLLHHLICTRTSSSQQPQSQTWSNLHPATPLLLLRALSADHRKLLRREARPSAWGAALLEARHAHDVSVERQAGVAHHSFVFHGGLKLRGVQSGGSGPAGGGRRSRDAGHQGEGDPRNCPTMTHEEGKKGMAR